MYSIGSKRLESRSRVCSPLGLAATSQRAWDQIGTAAAKSRLWADLPSPRDRARLLATSAPHASDWLYALPITTCGLRLEDEAIRVAIGLRLGLPICEPHPCSCGSLVEALVTQCLSCRRGSGRITRHQQLNDLLWRALGRAKIPAVKEPSGLARTDGKRPDSMSLIPWRMGRCLIWDVTVTDTLAASYVHLTSVSHGAAAEGAASRKIAKYADLATTRCFIPLAIETLGPICESGVSLLDDLGSRLMSVTGDPRERAFLYQRLSIAIQRGNSICFSNSFSSAVC